MITIVKTPARNKKRKLRIDSITIDRRHLFRVRIWKKWDDNTNSDIPYEVSVLARNARTAERLALLWLPFLMEDRIASVESNKIMVVSKVE